MRGILQTIYNAEDVLGADIVPDVNRAIQVGDCGAIRIDVTVNTNTATPLGTFVVYQGEAKDGSDKTPIDPNSSIMDEQMLNITPQGNTGYSGSATIRGLSARYAFIGYTRASGGGGNSTLTVLAKAFGSRQKL